MNEIGREREFSQKGDMFIKFICPCGQEIVQTFALGQKTRIVCKTCGRRTRLYASKNMQEALAVNLA